MSTNDTIPSVPPAQLDPAVAHHLRSLALDVNAAYERLIEETERAAERLTRRAARLRLERTQHGELAPSIVPDGFRTMADSSIRDDLLWLQGKDTDLDAYEQKLADALILAKVATSGGSWGRLTTSAILAQVADLVRTTKANRS